MESSMWLKKTRKEDDVEAEEKVELVEEDEDLIRGMAKNKVKEKRKNGEWKKVLSYIFFAYEWSEFFGGCGGPLT